MKGGSGEVKKLKDEINPSIQGWLNKRKFTL